MMSCEKKQVTRANTLLHGGDYNPDQWLNRPDILADDLKLMKLAHTNTYSIGIFAWSALEPEEGVYTFEWLDTIFETIHQNGGTIILATPSGARPAWLSQKYPEVLRTNELRLKHLQGARHNHCFSSPVYREKTQQINRLLAERYGNHPALLMWHVSNEYSGECHCDLCQVAFKDWLKKTYNNDLAALNEAWWGPFWSHTFNSWSQIQSPSPIGEDAVHGMNLDWRRFITDQTINFYQNELVPLRELTPNIPVTTNFMANTDDLIPYQGLDYGKFAKHVDVITWDGYPAWHNDRESTADLAMKVGFIDDLYRSLKQQPFLLLESTPSAVSWHEVNKAKRPHMHLLSSMQMIAHGSDSIMYFQWRKSRGSSEKFHGAVVDHDNSPENRVFKDVAEVGKILESLSAIAGTTRPADVAILYDWENNWALNDAQGYGIKTKNYTQTVQEHYRTFWEKDIPVDVIMKDQDFSSYKLIVIPMLYLLSLKTLSRLKEFVANGGTVVSTYMTGIVDEYDLAHLGGWPKDLQDIFGINLVETDTLYPSDRNTVRYGEKEYELKEYASLVEVKQAEIKGEYLEDFYAYTPAITSHSFEKGKSYFIGGRLEQSFHSDFYSEIIKDLGLMPVLSVRHEKGVSVQARQSETEDTVFVMNFSEETQVVYFDQPVWDRLSEVELAGEVMLEKYGVKVVTIL